MAYGRLEGASARHMQGSHTWEAWQLLCANRGDQGHGRTVRDSQSALTVAAVPGP